MKTNVCLISSLRKPFRSMLLLTLFGLISFGFITKAVGFILVQRETGVLAWMADPIVAAMMANPVLSNIDAKVFKILESHTAITRDLAK